MSRIKEKANKFIINELENCGIKGIVPSHGHILVILYQSKKHTMKELAEKIHRTKPTVTVLVDKLVQHGYVEKQKSAVDNRVTYITLTAKGWQLKPAFDLISEKLNAIIYGDFTDQQAQTFEKILANINQNLDDYRS